MHKTPAKLKDHCFNQLDHVMQQLGSSENISLTLMPFVLDEHIASRLLLEKINTLSGINCTWQTLSDLPATIPIDQYWIVISKQGNSYLVTGQPNNRLRLSTYFRPDEEVSAYEGTLEELKKDLGLITYALVLTKKSSQGPVASGTPVKTSFVWQHFFNQQSVVKVLISISVIIALLGVITPLGFQTFTDKILPYSAQSSLLVIVVLLLVAAAATSVFQCFHDYQQSVLFAKYQNGLGKEAFDRLLKMPVVFFDQQKVGDLTKLVDQIEESSNFLVHQLLSSVVSVISLVVVLPFLFMYSPKLASTVLLIGLLMALTVGLSLRALRKRVKQAYVYDASYQSTLIEMIKGMRTIKSLANEAHFRHRINTGLETNLYGNFHIARLGHVVRSIVNFQSQLISIAVIFFGAQAVFAGTMTIGQLIAFNMMAGNVVNPLMSLVMTASGWETFKLAKQRLEELEPPESLALPIEGHQLDLNGPIEFQDVWFRYPSSTAQEDQEEGDFVLKGISLHIKPNEIIGIVGGSGSGKSTLANLLLGFYRPSRGKITINGYDIDLIPPEVLRARISSVQQTSFLFNTTVLENVHLGRLNSNVEAIQAALVASGSQSFVDQMPQKFLTSLSEDGSNLSGGQRQRLAIARALV